MPESRALAAVDPIAAMRLRHGQTTMAVARLRSELEQDPANADLEVLLGLALTGEGQLAEALSAFESGRNSGAYGGSALESHADVLRSVGPRGAARALRQEGLWTASTMTGELEAFLELVDDSRCDGVISDAWDAATMAMTIAPERGAPYAQVAQLLMDEGRWDDARAYVDLAEFLGPPSLFVARASIRTLIHEGSLDRAAAISLQALQGNRNELALRVLRAEALTAAGQPEEALALVTVARFDLADHPAILLARLRAFRASGATAEADAVAGQLRRTYARPVLDGLGVMEDPSSPRL